MMRRIGSRAVPFAALLVLIPLLVIFSLIPFNADLSGDSEDRPAPTAAETDLAGRRLVANRREGRVMQALYQVESLAAQQGWTPDLLWLAGDLWREIGDLSSAVGFWEAAGGAQSSDVSLARGLALAYIELQRWPDATIALRRLAELTPADHWAHYQLGLILAAFDPLTAAVHLGIAAESPDYAPVALALQSAGLDAHGDSLLPMRVGIVLADHDLWPYAELAFRQAATIGGPFAEAAAYVGLARDQQGKDGSAWIERAVTADPQNPQVRYLQGLHLRAAGAYQKSLDALLMALALDPENAAFYADVGTAYRLLGDLQRAEYWLKTAVQVSHDAPEFQSLLALFYAEEASNLTSDGLDALQETSALLPNDPDVKAGFGWALHTLGQTEKGLLEIDAALRIAPENARALFYKASIWLETGRLDDAVPLLKRVADTGSPFADEARRILQNLGQ